MSDDEFDATLQAAGTPAVRWNSTTQGVKKLRYTHDDCIDCIIANPGIAQNDLAARYGYSVGWISLVINSDIFQAKLAERRAELIDPVLRASIEERFRAVAAKSAEVLLEKLSQPAHMVSDQLALQAAALGAKALGLGNAPPPPAPSSDGLASLAERLVGFVRNTNHGAVVDVTAREIQPN